MRHSNGNAEASGMGNFKQQKWFGTQLEVTADWTILVRTL